MGATVDRMSHQPFTRPLAAALTLLAAGAAAIIAAQPPAAQHAPAASSTSGPPTRQGQIRPGSGIAIERPVVGISAATCRHLYGENSDSHGELGRCLATALDAARP